MKTNLQHRNGTFMSFSWEICLLVWIYLRSLESVAIWSVRVEWHVMNVKLWSNLLRRGFDVIIAIIVVITCRRDKRSFCGLRSFLFTYSFILNLFRLILHLMICCCLELIFWSNAFFFISIENLCFLMGLFSWVGKLLISCLNTLWIMHMQSTSRSNWMA